MHIQPRTFGLFAAVAALALAGCEESSESGSDTAITSSPAAEPSDDGEAASVREAIAMEGTGWLTIGSDGSVQTTFLDPTGRYRDFRNGELLTEGSWERRPDDRICFEPDAGRGACWEIGAPGADGSVLATDGDGKSVEIKRVAYIPAPEADDGSE